MALISRNEKPAAANDYSFPEGYPCTAAAVSAVEARSTAATQ